MNESVNNLRQRAVRGVLLGSALLVAGAHLADAAGGVPGNAEGPPVAVAPGDIAPSIDTNLEQLPRLEFQATPEVLKEPLKDVVAMVEGLDSAQTPEVSAALLRNDSGKVVGASFALTPELTAPENQYEVDGKTYLRFDKPLSLVDKLNRKVGDIKKLLVGESGQAIGVLGEDGQDPLPAQMVEAYNAADNRTIAKQDMRMMKPGRAVTLVGMGRTQPQYGPDGKPIPMANPLTGDVETGIFLGTEAATAEDGTKQELHWVALPADATRLAPEQLLGATASAGGEKAFQRHGPATLRMQTMGNVVKVIPFTAKPDMVTEEVRQYSQQFHINLSRAGGLVALANDIPHDSVSRGSKNQYDVTTQEGLEAMDPYTYSPEARKEQALQDLQRANPTSVMVANALLVIDSSGPDSTSLEAMAGDDDGGGQGGIDPGYPAYPYPDIQWTMAAKNVTLWVEPKHHRDIVVTYYSPDSPTGYGQRIYRSLEDVIVKKSPVGFDPGVLPIFGPVEPSPDDWALIDGNGEKLGETEWLDYMPDQDYQAFAVPNAKPGEPAIQWRQLAPSPTDLFSR